MALPVRELPASVAYLPTPEQLADLAFLALASNEEANAELLQKLEHGQYISIADERGCSIMHKIVERGPGQDEFIALMHEKGAAIDYKNSNGKTPLMIAVAFRRMHYIKFFVENGADVQALDKQGMSLLHIACWYGHKEVLE